MSNTNQMHPSNLLSPLPSMLVTCGATPEEWTMMTIAWTGIICTDPAMCYIAVKANRASYPLLMKNMEYTINLATADMVRHTDWRFMSKECYYKEWEKAGLSPVAGDIVASPTIDESPVSLECKVKSIIHLGSHDMLLSEIVGIRVNSRYLDANGKFNLEDAHLLSYADDFLKGLAPLIRRYGYIVRDPENEENNDVTRVAG